jgi:hypothetical protein
LLPQSGQKDYFSGGKPPGMDIDTDTLLKVILVLVVVWLALEVLEAFVDVLQFILVPLPKLLGVAIIVLIVLYLLDRL